jgi:hypothetical protein
MILGEKLREIKIKKYFAQNKCCGVCGKLIPGRNLFSSEIAHRIPQTKSNLKKYGEEIIHHDLNTVLVDSKKCNSAVLIGQKPVRIAELVEKIKKALDKTE